MGQVIILRGVPGSGKSTWARMEYPDAPVFSADHYFEKSGRYIFDPSKLGEAHGECLRRFIDWANGSFDPIVIVDNTNTTVAEVAPYAAVALAYEHDVVTVTFLCDPKIGARRNVHGVPEKSIYAMDARLRASQRELMPWWNNQVRDCYLETSLGGFGCACD